MKILRIYNISIYLTAKKRKKLSCFRRECCCFHRCGRRSRCRYFHAQRGREYNVDSDDDADALTTIDGKDSFSIRKSISVPLFLCIKFFFCSLSSLADLLHAVRALFCFILYYFGYSFEFQYIGLYHISSTFGHGHDGCHRCHRHLHCRHCRRCRRHALVGAHVNEASTTAKRKIFLNTLRVYLIHYVE